VGNIETLLHLVVEIILKVSKRFGLFIVKMLGLKIERDSMIGNNDTIALRNKLM
jgi:hypothetical protein